MKGFLIGILAVLLIGSSFLMLNPSFRTFVREWEFTLDRVDEQTSYDNRKMVEDTARSSIVNYNSYKSEYDTYKSFCDTETYDDGKCTRAMNSKTSVNRVANQYNEYIQKNRFVFEDNLPTDIPESLEVV